MKWRFLTFIKNQKHQKQYGGQQIQDNYMYILVTSSMRKQEHPMWYQHSSVRGHHST